MAVACLAETRRAFSSASFSAISCGEARSASRLSVASASSMPDTSMSKLTPACVRSSRREKLAEARIKVGLGIG
jgi:hypothetical protein